MFTPSRKYIFGDKRSPYLSSYPPIVFSNKSLGGRVSGVSLFIPIHQSLKDSFEISKQITDEDKGGFDLALIPPIEPKQKKQKTEQQGSGITDLRVKEALEHPIKVN